MEKIERITRTNRVRFDTEELFERKRRSEDERGQQSFAELFREEQEAAEESKDRHVKIDRAYKLDVGRPTQSLFYQGKIDIRAMRQRLKNKLW